MSKQRKLAFTALAFTAFLDHLPAIWIPWSEQRLKSSQLLTIKGTHPCFLQSSWNQDGHAVMQWLNERIRNRGENGAGINLTAITTKPTLPETSKPEGMTVNAPNSVAFFEKTTSRNQTASMTPGSAETGFASHRF
jgi:hypothetical protein